MKEISIQEIENICIGQVEDPVGGTGLTAFICKDGMRAGIDVRGGGPASRETDLVEPLTSAHLMHGILLGGGSAFGLDAAGGVQQYLEEHDIGYDVGVAKVPLVCQSDIFDLMVGSPKVRPDKAMGYAAAKAALEENNYQDGCYGAGCGATVGKICGMDRCMKTGMGSCAVQLGDLKVGAVVAVNALGDIYDPHSGLKIAGLRTEDGHGFANTEEVLCRSIQQVENRYTDITNTTDITDASNLTNTTIGVIITNARFEKSQLCKIAGLGHDGYARCIRPVHTMADGDTIYAVSVGKISADVDLIGVLGAEVMSEAILRAVEHATSAFGIPCAREINGGKPKALDPRPDFMQTFT